MLIGKDWKIGADKLNIILYKRGIAKKTGRDTWRVMGYFATVGGALHELVNQRVRDTELKDLKTITKAIEELLGLITELPLQRPRDITGALKTNE